VVTEGKWKSVRLFEQCHCAICGGMLLGVMCEVRTFIVEFVREWGGAECKTGDGYIQRLWYLRLLTVK